MECNMGINKIKSCLKHYIFLIAMLIFYSSIQTQALANEFEEKTSAEQIYSFELESLDFVSYSKSGYTSTSAIARGKFFLNSNNETVATISLRVWFKYNGSSVEAYYSSASCEPKKADWAVSYGTTAYSNTTYNASGSVVFKLYYNGKYNNSLTAVVYCTKDGVTSSVIN